MPKYRVCTLTHSHAHTLYEMCNFRNRLDTRRRSRVRARSKLRVSASSCSILRMYFCVLLYTYIPKCIYICLNVFAEIVGSVRFYFARHKNLNQNKIWRLKSCVIFFLCIAHKAHRVHIWKYRHTHTHRVSVYVTLIRWNHTSAAFETFIAGIRQQLDRATQTKQPSARSCCSFLHWRIPKERFTTRARAIDTKEIFGQ